MRTKDDSRTVLRGAKTLIFVLLLFVAFSISLCACDDVEDKIPNTDYAITFVLNNGEENVVWYADDEACPLEMIDGVPTPKNGDLVFGGWYSDITLETPFAFDFENIFLTNSFTIYAKWRQMCDFEGLVFEDASIEYDGNPHTIAVSNLPQGATVTYVGEIQFVNVGEYEIVAVVRKDGYNDMELTATLTINKAQIEGVTFEDKTVVWDGEKHSIYVEGLPRGVAVEYTNNAQSTVGEHEVTASFDVGDNYLPLDDMSATLTILQKFCNVTFVIGDKKTVVEVPYGNTVTNRPMIDPKDGYQASWDTDISTEIRDDMTITAVYVPIEYIIEFDLCGGQGDFEDIIYTIESKDIELNTPSRRGYEFGGWYRDNVYTGDRVERIENGSFGNVKLYAKWTPIVYNVDYDLNVADAVNAENNPRTFTVESGIITLDAPSALGYTFVGWYLDEQFASKVESIDPSAYDDDVVLYARWNSYIYNIDYALDGGANDERNPKTYTYNEDCVLHAPTREHYDFVGWFDEDEMEVENLAGRAGDILLTARWTPTIYHINYVLDGGSFDGEVENTYTYFSSVTLPIPAKENCEFLGWYDNASFEGEAVVSIPASSEGDKTFYAKFTKIVLPFEYELRTQNEYGEQITPYYAITKYTGEEQVVRVPSNIDGNKIKTISATTFEGLAVTEIVIEEGILELEDGVFGGLDSLKTLKLPTSISYIPNGILKDCTSLSELVLPYVGDRIYKSTDKDRSLFGFSQLFEKSASVVDGFVCVPNYSLFADEAGSVRATEEGTFARIPTTLTNVTVLGGDIFNYAFAYCDNIEVLSVHGGEYIADFAIRECANLSTLTIDGTFENISTNALYSSQNIQEIVVGKETQHTFFEELKGRGKIGENVTISISSPSEPATATINEPTTFAMVGEQSERATSTPKTSKNTASNAVNEMVANMYIYKYIEEGAR